MGSDAAPVLLNSAVLSPIIFTEIQVKKNKEHDMEARLV